MCDVACPVDALDLTIDGKPIKEIETYPRLVSSAEISDDACVYCKACERACPQEAVTVARVLPDRSKLVSGEIEINKEKCIDCGVCEEMCPADAITIEQKGPEDFEISVDEEKCVYCGVCKRACPENAIMEACRACSYGEYEISPEAAEITGKAIIDEESCVRCGWCEDVCPKEAVTVEKPFEGELEFDEDKCTTCGACVDICPCDVLEFHKPSKPAEIGEKIDKKEQFCIYCGACANVCPTKAINVKRTAVNYTPTKSKSWQQRLESLKT